MQLPHLPSIGGIIAILALHHDTVRVVIADIAHVLRPNRARHVDAVVAAITGSDDVFRGWEFRSEKISPFVIFRNLATCQRERGGGQIDQGDEVVDDFSLGDPRMLSGDHQRDVQAAFIAKLFVA